MRFSRQPASFHFRNLTLLAITPQLAEASHSLIEKHGIGFDLLSDPGNDYAANLGLRFKLPDDLKAVYLSFGIDLAAGTAAEVRMSGNGLSS